MDDFKNAGLGTFEEELQRLVDYGHDCCARIDDKIHECCQRIREAHDVEVGGYAMVLGWKEQQGEWATTYDVLGNERHKAVCELRKSDFTLYTPDQFVSTLYKMLHGTEGFPTNIYLMQKGVRDRLIHLLGGDTAEVEDGMDAAGRGVCDCVSADVPAAGRPDDSGDRTDNQGQVLAPVTQELRNYLEAYRPVETDTCMEVARIGTLGYQGIMERLDAIDAVHANLERENAELRKRTMYPAESERVNMLEREVKRLTAECKTQRNNFDQATSAREHWKNLYEQALEHTHDLERDYEVACHVNEKQEREYLEWYNKACRMQKEIDDLKAKSGDMWLKGYHECREELMEGNAILAADLEKAGWMQLPKDSDGEYIHIGDVMAYEDNTKPMEVVALVPPAVFLTEDGPRYADMCRHHHEPTVEDVLREFFEEVGDGLHTLEAVDTQVIIAKYAAKLRLAEGEDA